ncbi:MAG: serpin family protein [Deltaproteobacteria bacterium]|nr:serpin family protein [Deltaproteobacteria bacterium]
MKTQKMNLGSMLLFALMSLLFACGESGNDENSSGDSVDSATGDTGTEAADTESETGTSKALLQKSEKARDMEPAPSEEVISQVVASNSAFAMDVYGKLREGNSENLFFSPLSLSAGMAISYAGARSTTESQMAATLHWDAFGQEALHEALNKLLLTLSSRATPQSSDDAGGFELSIFNSLWAQKDFVFHSAYLDLLAANYDTGVWTVDFDNNLNKSIATINDWVAENTQNKIQDVLNPAEIVSPILAVLVNAIYFKAAWNLPFDESETTLQPFSLLSGETVNVNTMAIGEHFSYGKGDGYEAVALEYDGEDVDMVIIAPDVGTFEAFETSLDASKLKTILDGMASRYTTWVTLTVPRFHIASKWEMSEIFEGLAMEAPFGTDADFSGMSDTFLRIKKIIHQTDITVDEKGTEAAAATVIVDGNGDADYATVNLNRPFLFIIRDQPTNTILFMGRVTNPSRQD